jgi:hypothetical protein
MPSVLHISCAVHSSIQVFLQSSPEADCLRASQHLDICRQEWRGLNEPPVLYFKEEPEGSLSNTAGERLLSLHRTA